MKSGPWSEQLRGMRQEWQGNPRLRLGVLVVVAISVLYGCLVLNDWRHALHAQYQQRTLQLYKMSALAGQEHWLSRAQSAKDVEKALQAEIPNATTIGLAQAEVQTMVRQLIDAFGRKMTTESRPPVAVPGQPGLWRVPVTLRGALSSTQLLEMLRRLEDADRLMVIDESQITFPQGVPTVSLTLSAFYRVGDGKPQGDGNGAG